MKNIFTLFIILFVLIAGCGSYQIPQPDINHPAHPQAITSGNIEQAEALEVDDKNLPKMPDEMKNRQIHMKNTEGNQQ